MKHAHFVALMIARCALHHLAFVVQVGIFISVNLGTFGRDMLSSLIIIIILLEYFSVLHYVILC